MFLVFINLTLGLLLFLVGYLILQVNKTNTDDIVRLIHARKVALFSFWPGCIWFLLIILNLGEADFGDYKNILFVLFAIIFIYAYINMKEWLSVRGMSIFALLFCRFLLDANYASDKIAGKFVAFILYVIIVIAMWLGAEPFRFRNFLNWLAEKNVRTKLVAVPLFLYSVLIVVSSLLN